MIRNTPFFGTRKPAAGGGGSPGTYTDGLWKFAGNLNNEVEGGDAATAEGAGYEFPTISTYQGIRGLDATANDFASVPYDFTDADWTGGKSLTVEVWHAWTQSGVITNGYPMQANAADESPNIGPDIFCQIYGTVNANFYMRGYLVNPSPPYYVSITSAFLSTSINVWHHLAWVFDYNSGNPVARLFRNGVNLTNFSRTGFSLGSGGRIYFSNKSRIFREVRISNIARYTSNFTPATSFTVD